ncbi:hypothetical protein XENOCAPTIV_018977, partial [Xenoophorus captivus]
PATPKKLLYLLQPPVQVEVAGRRGDNVTLPCILRTKPNHYKIKWTKLESEYMGQQNVIMISNANAFKPYGHVGQRASLQRAHSMDASLLLSNVELGDDGRYRCELINGIEDENILGLRGWTGAMQVGFMMEQFIIQSFIPDLISLCFVSLSGTGSVFYIFGSFSYDQAVHACKHQGSELALVGQLYAAWRFQKYDHCNGGWLKDGSVRFPIINPRKHCGGIPEAGVRSFGFPSKTTHLYGAYCYR